MKTLLLGVLILLGLEAKADYALTNALQACLNSSVGYDVDEANGTRFTCKSDKTGNILEFAHSLPIGHKLYLNKIAVDGTSDSIVGLTCYDDRAKNLFEAIDRYARQYQQAWSDGSTVITRDIGGMRCYRKLRTSNGSESNSYWCIQDLKLNSYVVKALDLK